MKFINIKILITAILFIFPRVIFASVDTFPAFLMNNFIKENGSILVSEEFIFDYGNNPRHGIIRTIPLVLNGSNRWYEIANIEVKDKNTNPIGIESTNTGNNAQIKIGDPNITLTGTHYYNLRYSISNVAGNTELSYKLLNPMREQIAKFESNIYFPVLIPIGSATSTCEMSPNRHDVNNCKVEEIIKSNKIAGYKYTISQIEKEEVVVKIKYPMGVVLNNFVEEKNGLRFYLNIPLMISALLLIIIATLIYKYRKSIANKINYLKIHADNPEIYSYIERGYYYNQNISKFDLVHDIADLCERGYIKLSAAATPVGETEFIDYHIEVISSEIDNEVEKYLLEELKNNEKTLSDFIKSNFESISAHLIEISKRTMDSKKLLKDTSMKPDLEGFKIL